MCASRPIWVCVMTSAPRASLRRQKFIAKLAGCHGLDVAKQALSASSQIPRQQKDRGIGRLSDLTVSTVTQLTEIEILP